MRSMFKQNRYDKNRLPSVQERKRGLIKHWSSAVCSMAEDVCPKSISSRASRNAKTLFTSDAFASAANDFISRYEIVCGTIASLFGSAANHLPNGGEFRGEIFPAQRKPRKNRKDTRMGTENIKVVVHGV